MSKSGGITYLLKHGRAPMAGVTRTKMPRMGIKKLAAGGDPINAPLNYAEVPDYTFEQADTSTPEYDQYGQRIYRSGTLKERKKAAALPNIAMVDPMKMIGQGRDGSRETPAGHQTNWREVTGDLSIPEGAKWGDLTTGQQRDALSKVDPYGVGQGIRSLVDNSMLGKAAKGFGTMMDRAMGREVQPYTGATAGAANPMQRDPMQMAQQGGGSFAYDPRTGGYPSSGGPLSGAAWGETPASGGKPGENAMGGFGGYRDSYDSATSAPSAAPEGKPGENAMGGYGGYRDSYDSSDNSTDFAAGGLSHNGHIRHMAAGGIGSLAEHGGYSTSHAAGGRMLRGPGDGLSDNIPAVIGKDQPARLADGEFVVSADVVSALGGGSTEAGSKKLYAMMDRIRKSAHGTKKQVKKVHDHKVLPA